MALCVHCRASTDYHAIPDPTCKYGAPNPTCTQYNIFLTGLVYSAIGIAPSKDNFRSSSVQQINGQREANPLLQALVSGLSCGPCTSRVYLDGAALLEGGAQLAEAVGRLHVVGSLRAIA